MRLITLVLLVACDDGGSDDTGSDWGGSDSSNAISDGDDTEGDSDDLGSEDETTLLGLRPATTPAYVFVANADRDTISRIAVPALDVLTARVG
ncbi:MAG: hypothetical protein ACI8RZ_006226, partial [Myxococcota bacterium]